MSRYGYFNTFCRDSGNRWSTLPGMRRAFSLSLKYVLLTCRSVLCTFSHSNRTTTTPRMPTLIPRQLFDQAPTKQNTGWGNNACELEGIALSGDNRLANLGQSHDRAGPNRR
jgi:hypothetical protein